MVEGSPADHCTFEILRGDTIKRDGAGCVANCASLGDELEDNASSDGFGRQSRNSYADSFPRRQVAIPCRHDLFARIGKARDDNLALRRRSETISR